MSADFDQDVYLSRPAMTDPEQAAAPQWQYTAQDVLSLVSEVCGENPFTVTTAQYRDTITLEVWTLNPNDAHTIAENLNLARHPVPSRWTGAYEGLAVCLITQPIAQVAA
ncbi:hypothetical protein [Georgenia thermotolerans]|uniref:hypothetical protein n=1 Tax=Georgenia thermotolerans TaxID=527326 RepID=UPI00126588F1|nr:hypothetical protein [Georgenia thermotolerans]